MYFARNNFRVRIDDETSYWVVTRFINSLARKSRDWLSNLEVHVQNGRHSLSHLQEEFEVASLCTHLFPNRPCTMYVDTEH
jgi:hypothetical protein